MIDNYAKIGDSAERTLMQSEIGAMSIFDNEGDAKVKSAVASILLCEYDESEYFEHVQTLAEARIPGCEIIRLKTIGRLRRALRQSEECNIQ